MNGVKNLIKTIVVGTFIILAYLGMSCSEVKADEWAVCTPYKVEVCSICGHKYNNDGCPHTEGQVYGAEECNPKEGLICNICGNDYNDSDSCSHYDGVEYGGIDCEPWRECNICGEDFDDGSVCSHHKGESYGGQLCETYTVLICNICGNDYEKGSECFHARGTRYNKVYCEPDPTDMCNICDRPYLNGGCPHVIGRYYGGTECVPIMICNICGNECGSEDCPHTEGEHYGTVCEVYSARVCNICGHDYDDGDVCSHQIGQFYGETECEIEDVDYCNICKKRYFNGGCPHSKGAKYRFVAYYIYLPEWEERALNFRQTFMDTYGLDESGVVLLPVSNEDEFREAWNSIGNVDGELVYPVSVVIETHGTNEVLKNNKDKAILTEEGMEQLEDKYTDMLVLLACNAGHLDNKEHNPAAYIAKKLNGAPVLASDGTVYLSDKLEYMSDSDGTFLDMCGNNKRDNEGWLFYFYSGGRVYTHASLGKYFTSYGLLEVIN